MDADLLIFQNRLDFGWCMKQYVTGTYEVPYNSFFSGILGHSSFILPWRH